MYTSENNLLFVKYMSFC